MKFTNALLLLVVIAAVAGAPNKSPKSAELEVKLRNEVDRNAELNIENIETGKLLQNVAHELKLLAKKNKEAGDEISPYKWRDFFSRIKEVLKEAAKKAVDAGKEHLLKKVKEIVMENSLNTGGMYAFEDDVAPLSQVYESLAEKLDTVGKAFELAGAEIAV